MATVFVPALLRDRAGGAERVEVDIPPHERLTVRQVLERLNDRQRGLLEGLPYRGELMPGSAVFVDNEHALMGLQARVAPSSTIHFLPPVVGGR